MLTVLIDAAEDPNGLALTLSTLVAGAVEGLVREVVVIDRGLDAATRKVADHAGCHIVQGGTLPQIVAAAKGDWLLLLEPGARLSLDWIDSVTSHIGEVELQAKTPRAARFSRARRDRQSFVGSLFTRFTGRRTALVEGLLVTKAQAIGPATRSAVLEDMGQGLATSLLEATIRPRSQVKQARPT